MDHKSLCLNLAQGDTEKDIISLLKNVGYWDNPDVWQYYGDIENNYGTIGNQSNMAEYALVEKITNSIDAILISECLKKGIDPKGENAPQNINEALNKFFKIPNGELHNISSNERTQLANKIKLVVTGSKTNPSYSIIDFGEGQTPNLLPSTILSIGKENKTRIPFVHGRFNQGGTASLLFCGELGLGNNIQLVISRRNPQISKLKSDDSREYWGFTIVRRFEEDTRNSTFKYLAPNNKILRFKSNDGIPLLPDKYPVSYGKIMKYGTFIKLYNYQIPSNLKPPANMNLNWRLSLLLPTLALPFRIYERRNYGKISRTIDATVAGLSVRLKEDIRNNIEDKFPTSANITIQGQKIDLKIYAFKKDKENNKSRKIRYASNKEGIIFTINGQTHTTLPQTFFSSKKTNMEYIADSILIVADCSKLRPRLQLDLFKTSRDRHMICPLFRQIEDNLREIIREHPGLDELKNHRQAEDVRNKIINNKQLEMTINKIIKKSPILTKILLQGKRISNPFKPIDKLGTKKFKQKNFPTHFELIKPYPKTHPKICCINSKFRIQYSTDAENEYFTRDKDKGYFEIKCNGKNCIDKTWSLWEGIFNLNVKIPQEFVIGDILHFETEVSDISQIEPFNSEFNIIISEEYSKKNSKKYSSERKQKTDSSEKGLNKITSQDDLAIPDIREVRSDEWNKFGMNKFSSLIIKEIDANINHYRFFINIDNIHLLSEIKNSSKINLEILKTQYVTAIILIGMSLLTDHIKNNDNSGETSIYKLIPLMTELISPTIIPLISSLGKL